VYIPRKASGINDFREGFPGGASVKLKKNRRIDVLWGLNDCGPEGKKDILGLFPR